MAYGTMSIGGIGLKTNDDFVFEEDGTMKINKLTYWPVGSIYQSIDSTSPAELFGGTWESIASNRVLMGAVSGNPAGTIAEAGLPNITGYFNFEGSDDEVWSKVGLCEGAFYGEKNVSVALFKSPYTVIANQQGIIRFSAEESNPIYGNSDIVQPPAYFVHIWKRVA